MINLTGDLPPIVVPVFMLHLQVKISKCVGRKNLNKITDLDLYRVSFPNSLLLPIC